MGPLRIDGPHEHADIRAVELTPSSDGDSPVLPELLDQIPNYEESGKVTADGACDIHFWSG